MLFGPPGESLAVRLDDEGGDFVFGLAVNFHRGIGEDGEKPGITAIGDPHLLSIEQPGAVGLFFGPSLDGGGVASCTRFREGEGGDGLATGQVRQILAFLLPGAVEQQPFEAD